MYFLEQNCAIHILSQSTINVYVISHSLYQHQFLSEALQWRAQTDPDHVLYVLLNAKVDKTHTCAHTNLIILRNQLIVRTNVSEKHTVTNNGEPFCWV